MNKFEIGKTYCVKNGVFELHFKCAIRDEKRAGFMLTDIKADTSLGSCPVLFSILQDYYNNFHGEMIEIYNTYKIENDGEREVVLSDYENYLWIDSNNLL